jgi:hypothetical protein
MRIFSLLLSSLIALHPIWAQSGGGAAAPPTNNGSLRVRLVDGPGPPQAHTKSAKGYVLQVTNAAGAPVSGAAVALRLPENGATGRFADGLRSWVAYSDDAGIARFPVIQWGEIAGDVQVSATAAKATFHVGLLIAQSIRPDPGTVSVVSVPIEKMPPKVASTQEPTTVAENRTIAAAHPALLPTPEISLPTPESSISFKPLADIVPPSAIELPAPPQEASDAAKPQPGAVSQQTTEAAKINGSPTGSSASEEQQHPLTPNPPPPVNGSGEPTVTITNSPTGAGSTASHKKIWVLVGIGAGAGAAAMLAILGHSSAAGAAGGGSSSSGVAVGAPTITVGH